MYYLTPPFKIPIGIGGGDFYVPVEEALFFFMVNIIFPEIENNKKTIETHTEMHNYIFFFHKYLFKNLKM